MGGPRAERLQQKFKMQYELITSAGRRRRHKTYISRLQTVQAAVDQQLLDMAANHPHRRVALVTFGSEITVHGDGSSAPLTFEEDILNEGQQLIDAAQSVPFPTNIQTQVDTLSDKLFR